MDIAEKLIRAKADYDAVHEAGKQAEYHKFWDNFQQNGTRRNYWGAFTDAGWNDETFKPKYPLNDVYEAAYMFYRTGITKIPAFTVTYISLANTFSRATVTEWVEEIIITREVTSTTNLFMEASSLVHCPITTTGNGAIAGSIDASACPFDKETIISWVNALSETKTGLTITFNLDAVNKAFETSEGANDGSTSAEWQALKETKPNWAFAYA